MNVAPRLLPLRLLRRSICASCLRQLQRRDLHATSRLQDKIPTFKSYIAQPGQQASPLAGYYADLLDQPLSKVAAATRTPLNSVPDTKTEREERIAKAQLVFGSRLAGPLERRKHIDAQSTVIAGITVPPRPGEPDNCCMSGCANCVWDLYRDDLEEWAAQSKKAREALEKQKKRERKPIPGATGSMLAGDGTPSHVATSMDDDGGGSESLWGTSSDDKMNEELFAGVPVGIRAFMQTEKMLKSRHAQERAGAS